MHSCGLVCEYETNARSAAATAVLTSASRPSTTRPVTSTVAGSASSRNDPWSGACQAPSRYSSLCSRIIDSSRSRNRGRAANRGRRSKRWSFPHREGGPCDPPESPFPRQTSAGKSCTTDEAPDRRGRPPDPTRIDVVGDSGHRDTGATEASLIPRPVPARAPYCYFPWQKR